MLNKVSRRLTEFPIGRVKRIWVIGRNGTGKEGTEDDVWGTELDSREDLECALVWSRLADGKPALESTEDAGLIGLSRGGGDTADSPFERVRVVLLPISVKDIGEAGAESRVSPSLDSATIHVRWVSTPSESGLTHAEAIDIGKRGGEVDRLGSRGVGVEIIAPCLNIKNTCMSASTLKSI